MKVWRAWVSDGQEGICYVWGTSRRGVRVLARDTFNDGPEVHCEQIDIPATKTGLVNWLNDNFTRDNG